MIRLHYMANVKGPKAVDFESIKSGMIMEEPDLIRREPLKDGLRSSC